MPEAQNDFLGIHTVDVSRARVAIIFEQRHVSGTSSTLGSGTNSTQSRPRDQ